MPFDNLVRFLQEKTKNLKKGDWIALALTGVLLLVVALPEPSAGNAKKEKNSMHVTENKTEEVPVSGTSKTTKKKAEQKGE